MVCVTQAGSVITGVLGEQLEEETKRMELVEQKKLTWQDAEEEADAWEKVRDLSVWLSWVELS
jgi:hypothetical protein